MPEHKTEFLIKISLKETMPHTSAKELDQYNLNI